MSFGVWVALSAAVVGGPELESVRPTSTRTVIVFDNSGSMRSNDPHRLAPAAAMLYVQLAKKKDHLGLVVFDQKARLAVPLQGRGSVRQRIGRKLAGLRLSGALTDIGSALELALDTLGEARPQTADVVVLLTDGHVDLGAGRKAAVSKEVERIRTQVVERYRQRRVSLYAIAFTNSADRALLSDISGQTRGAFRYISTPQELHRAFSDLFTVASGASSLPVRDGAVVVDPSIRQTSFVMTKKNPGDAHQVVAPDEEVLTARHSRDGLKWKSSPSYDLVEIDQPQVGAWQMLDQEGEAADAVAIVKDSGLDLDVRFGPRDATIDDSLEFIVELMEHGRRVTNFARLKSMSVEAVIEDPNQKRRTVLFGKGDVPGRFVGSVHNSELGHHAIQITALSPVLQRQWRGSYLVRPRCFEPKFAVDLDPPTVVVRLSKDCPRYVGLKIEVARHLDGEEPLWLPAQPDRNGVFGRQLPPLTVGEKGAARLRVTATSDDGYPILVEPDPVPLPEVPDGVWLQIVGTRLAYINVPIGVLLAVGYALRRARRSAERGDDG